MATLKEIRQVSDRIAEQFVPEKIVLFGSYAYGTPRRGSDVDLLVVMKFRGHSARMAARIANQIDSRLPVELLVRTPTDIRRRLEGNAPFLKEILARGTVLHESDHRRGFRRHQLSRPA